MREALADGALDQLAGDLVEDDPRRDGLDPDTVAALSREIDALDWRLYDIEIVPARLDERTVGHRRADRPPRGMLRDP